MSITSITRDWGIDPSIVRILTTDTLATVTATGYLMTQQRAIRSLNNGDFDWSSTDYVLVNYSDNGGSWGFFSYVPSTQSLVPASSGGGGDVTKAEVQQSAFNHGTDTGTSTAYAVALSPSISSYTDGLLVSFTPTNTNTDNFPTLNINGIGDVQITINAGTSFLSIGDLNSNLISQLIYSAASNQFILLNPQVSVPVLRDMMNGNGYWTNLDSGPSANNYILNLAANVASGAFQFAPIFVVLQGANATNTGASTLTFTNSSSFAIVDSKGNALVGGEIVAFGSYFLFFDGSSSYRLLNSSL